MKYRTLGKSGLQISEVGFGCMSLGEDHNENARILNKAFEEGINFFDTADVYQKGFNETTVGKALKPIRDKVFVATKVGNRWQEGESGFQWDPSKKYILSAVEKSLKRLETDYLDLYQLHGGTIEDPIDETIEAFEQLRREGKIRHYGISSIRPNVIREYVTRSSITSVMMQYSLLDRRPEETCLALLADNNIGVIARGTLAGGLLVDKPSKAYLSYSEEEVRKVAEAVDSVSGITNTSVALQFVLRQPAVSAAIVGVRKMDQLVDVIQAVNEAALSGEDFESLARTLPLNLYEGHR